MSRILIINQGDTENYGDIALCSTIEKFYKDNNFEVDFISYWNEKKIFGENYCGTKIKYRIIMKIPFLTDYYYKRYLKKYVKNVKYDKVLIGGGELLSGHKGFNNALYNITSYFYKKTKLFVISVSGNYNMKRFYLNRYKKALSRCTRVFVRDYHTKKMCQELYKLRKVEQWPDVVFAYKIINHISLPPLEKKENTVVLVPIEYYDEIGQYLNLKNEDEFIDYICNYLIENISKNQTIIITPTVKEDNIISKRLYYRLKQKITNKIIVKEYTKIEDYIEIMKNSKKVISCRMHGLILAKIFNCEIKTIVFKTKMKVFKDEYENFQDITKIESDALKSLKQIFNDNDKV